MFFDEAQYWFWSHETAFAYLGDGERPQDHFELKRPLTRDTPRPILLVTFKEPEWLGEATMKPMNIAAGTKRRKVYFYGLREER